MTAVAALPSHAAAATIPTLVDQHGAVIHGQRVTWLKQSRMPLVGGRIRIVTAGCPGFPLFSGCVLTRRPRTLYMRPGAPRPKAILYHELGHTFDLLKLHQSDRSAFKRMLHLRGTWFRGSGPPAEMFAEAYALCSRFGVRRPAASQLGWTKSLYGYRPTRKQHRAVCELILRAGSKKRAGAKPQPPPNAPPVIEQKPPAAPGPQTGGPGTLPGVPGLPVPPLLGGTLGS